MRPYIILLTDTLLWSHRWCMWGGHQKQGLCTFIFYLYLFLFSLWRVTAAKKKKQDDKKLPDGVNISWHTNTFKSHKTFWKCRFCVLPRLLVLGHRRGTRSTCRKLDNTCWLQCGSDSDILVGGGTENIYWIIDLWSWHLFSFFFLDTGSLRRTCFHNFLAFKWFINLLKLKEWWINPWRAAVLRTEATIFMLLSNKQWQIQENFLGIKNLLI